MPLIYAAGLCNLDGFAPLERAASTTFAAATNLPRGEAADSLIGESHTDMAVIERLCVLLLLLLLRTAYK